MDTRGLATTLFKLKEIQMKNKATEPVFLSRYVQPDHQSQPITQDYFAILSSPQISPTISNCLFLQT